MSILSNKSANSHGMGTDLVKPDWNYITIDEVNLLLQHYPQFTKATALTWHSPRPFSSATIAVIDGFNFFVKRHRSLIRDVKGLSEEHQIMQYLDQNQITVSKVVMGQNNETAFSLDTWTYEIHNLGCGTDLYCDAVSWSPFICDQHAYAAGVALAEVHLAAVGYDAPARKTQTLVSSFEIFNTSKPLQAMEIYINKRFALVNYLEKIDWKRDFKKVLFPLYEMFYPYAKDLTPLWTHNDWHASNLLWSDDSLEANVVTILDFGLANRTNAVYDLATAIERNIIEWLEIESGRDDLVHFSALEALLDGYESKRPLSIIEGKALSKILPLVHVEFALSEVDYFNGIVQSKENADLAYFTYLLGHAEWFSKSQGQALLSFLERRYNR